MRTVYIALTCAAALWFMMFANFTELTSTIHNSFFWYAMVASTVALATFTLHQRKGSLGSLFSFSPKLILIGLAHAVLLYGFSRLGIYIMTSIFDWSAPQIQAAYQTRYQLSPNVIAPLLFFIIAPCEEIFWRGYMQNSFSERFGKMKGLVITSILYSLIHVWSGNIMLVIAALVLGIHWGLLYKKFNSLVPGVISHAVWDTLIFVIFPVQL